jgi:uncharacterized membrane protein
MLSSSLVMLHICAAVVALLSGFLSSAVRKGAGMHRVAGNVFFISMLTMASSAAWLSGVLRPNAANFVVSLLTLYLVATAWWAARRRDGVTGMFDVIALLYVVGVGVLGMAGGIEAANSPRGTKDHMPAAVYFVFGTVALLCAFTDVRMLMRGGVTGARRIARHLWRMSLALLIATLSFYPGQARQLPDSLRGNSLMFIPHVLLIGSMLFWMARMSARKRAERKRSVAAPAAFVVQTGVAR